jgi:hypothetical protein
MFRYVRSLVVLLAALSLPAGLLVTATPVLAAPPELPIIEPPTAVTATEATFNGVLFPSSIPTLGSTYEFIYRSSATECQGPGQKTAPEPPGMAILEAEPVSQAVTNLTPDTSYTVCLLARDGAGAKETSISAPLTFVTVPEQPETDPATEVTGRTAQLHGVLNPTTAGEPGSYEFVLRPSAGECEGEGETTTPEGQSTGAAAEPVQTEATGLLPATTYTFCLVARNSSRERAVGPPKTFTTLTTAPTVTEESFSSLGSTEVTLTAQIDPGGAPTTYHVDYGVSTPEVSLPASSTPIAVQQRLIGLKPATEYHFRFVAHNTLGTREGALASVTTPASSGSALTLPDGRDYELVSGLGNPGEVYTPPGPQSVPQRLEDVVTESSVRASADGDTVTYVGDPGTVGGNGRTGNGLGNEFVATRDPAQSRWGVNNVTPEGTDVEHGAPIEYVAFSSNLSLGVLASRSQSLAELARPEGPFPCTVLYSYTGDLRAGSEFHALFTETETPGSCGTTENGLQFAGANEGTPSVGKASHLLFQTPAALTSGAERSPAGEGRNLYDSTAGQVRLVNILPNGKTSPNAVLGGAPGEAGSGGDFSNVISADGSLVFWTDLNTHRLYVRQNADQPPSPLGPNEECTVSTAACTRALSQGEARFWTATSDGRYVFYTEDKELWRADTTLGTTEDLVGEGLVKGEVPGVQGVIGASDDGAYVYLVAGGYLASEAEKRKCKEARQEETEKFEAGTLSEEERIRLETEQKEEQDGRLPAGRGCNLYLWHSGKTTFVTTLAAQDNNLEKKGGSKEGTQLGAWQPNLGARTAEVTPGGHQLVFESTQQLTGYTNSLLDQRGSNWAVEVFVYDAPTGRLSCASCDPSGAPALLLGDAEGATYLSYSSSPTSLPRWISDDGNRVFFNTSQALVAQDTNSAQDVYEWEREGTESCRVATSMWGGCVFLLSGGNSSDFSYFIDADVTGNNVFFTHRGRLGGSGAFDDKTNLYDARVNGGFPTTALACTGTGCQGVPPSPPSFATPSSVTFNGVGNYLPGVSGKPRSKSAAKIKAEKLIKALKACRAKRSRHRRAACEAQARTRYGPSHRVAKSGRARKASDKRRAMR